jgi:hypothetical protein
MNFVLAMPRRACQSPWSWSGVVWVRCKTNKVFLATPLSKSIAARQAVKVGSSAILLVHSLQITSFGELPVTPKRKPIIYTRSSTGSKKWCVMANACAITGPSRNQSWHDWFHSSVAQHASENSEPIEATHDTCSCVQTTGMCVHSEPPLLVSTKKPLIVFILTWWWTSCCLWMWLTRVRDFNSRANGSTTWHLVHRYQELAAPQLAAASTEKLCLAQLSCKSTLVLSFMTLELATTDNTPPRMYPPDTVELGAIASDVQANIQGRVTAEPSVMMASFRPETTHVTPFCTRLGEVQGIISMGVEYQVFIVYVCGDGWYMDMAAGSARNHFNGSRISSLQCLCLWRWVVDGHGCRVHASKVPKCHHCGRHLRSRVFEFGGWHYI